MSARRGAARGLFLLRLGAAILLLMSLVSLVASPSRLTSLPYVVQIVAGTTAVLLIAGRPVPALRRWATPWRITAFFLGAGFVAVVAILVSTRWPIYKLSFLSGVYAVLPSIRSLPLPFLAQGLTPNQAGGLMATFTAFGLAVLVARPPRQPDDARRWVTYRRAAGALSVTGFVVVFMTGSRASLVAVAVALAVLLTVRSRRWLLLVPAGVALAGVAVAVRPSLPGSALGVLLRDETVETKLLARIDIWHSVLRGIEDHPFTGIGLGVLNQVLPYRYPYETVGLSFTVTHAHDVFLDSALTLGVPGLAGLLLLLAGMIQLALAAPRDDPVTRACSLGMMAATVVFMTFGITDSLSFSTPSTLVLWAWSIALSLLTPPAPSPSTVVVSSEG